MFSHAIPSMAQAVQVCTGVFHRLTWDHLCQLWCCYVLMLLASCFLPNPLPCFFHKLEVSIAWNAVVLSSRQSVQTPQQKIVAKSLELELFSFSPWNLPEDLRRLGRPMERLVLVDNSPVSLALCLDNGIIVSSWTWRSTSKRFIKNTDQVKI